MHVHLRRLSGALSAAIAVSATALPISAQADVVSLSTCNSNTLSQAFAPWQDPSNYEVAPGGQFNDSSWTLAGGARLVPGAEPYAAAGSLSSNSLDLPTGSTATSPSTCVTAAYPTIRFFVSGSGAVQVNVIYGGQVIQSGVVPANGSWAPSPVLATGSAVVGAANGGTAQVQLQLTAVQGEPQVSDVFIDPWGRG
jgi:hypothetical protein